MRDKHIISLIESVPFSRLREEELATVLSHAKICLECRQAFEAAQIAGILLKERALETIEPAPFFHTKVLTALREQQTANEPWAWIRMWRAAGALASSMAVTVATLAVLTVVMPGTQKEPQEITSVINAYTAEDVIFNQGELAEDQLSDGQVLTALYEEEQDTVK
jgi:hypothetical protein